MSFHSSQVEAPSLEEKTNRYREEGKVAPETGLEGGSLEHSQKKGKPVESSRAPKHFSNFVKEHFVCRLAVKRGQVKEGKDLNPNPRAEGKGNWVGRGR